MSEQITITLPDGSTQTADRGTTPAAVAAQIGSRLAKAAIAAKVDGEWVDLERPLTDDARLEIVVAASEDGREVLRHSTAHVMAEAVTRLFPGAKYTIGPAITDGFYYDFDLPDSRTFNEDDLAKIEDEMRAIVKADQAFVREEVSYDDALAQFADQPYKQEIIEKVRAGDADAEDAGEVGGDDAVCRCTGTSSTATSSSPTCAAAHTCRALVASVRSS